jgi:hypothetical protein
LPSSPGRRCGAGAGDGGGIFATATGSMATRTCFPAPFRGICELVGSGARESGGSKRPEKSQNLLCCASCCASCCADCGWGAAGVVLGRACGMGGLRHAWPFAALTAAGGGDSVGVRPGWTHTQCMALAAFCSSVCPTRGLVQALFRFGGARQTTDIGSTPVVGFSANTVATFTLSVQFCAIEMV